MDSSLGSNLSPTLSPDMKGFFKEKLRSIKPRKGSSSKANKVEDSKKGSTASTTAGAVTTGYSHLDCCADVPYNLAEEPEQVGTLYTNTLKYTRYRILKEKYEIFTVYENFKCANFQVDGVDGDEGESRSLFFSMKLNLKSKVQFQ